MPFVVASSNKGSLRGLATSLFVIVTLKLKLDTIGASAEEQKNLLNSIDIIDISPFLSVLCSIFPHGLWNWSTLQEENFGCCLASSFSDVVQFQDALQAKYDKPSYLKDIPPDALLALKNWTAFD